jgi:hypothetical protein
LTRFEFESGTVLFCFSFTFVSFGESCLLVLCCAGGRCGMACSDEDRGRVGDLVQRTGDGRTDRVLGGWAVERSGGAVCGLHVTNGDCNTPCLYTT